MGQELVCLMAGEFETWGLQFVLLTMVGWLIVLLAVNIEMKYM